MLEEHQEDSQQYSEYDYCPICGELAVGEKKHICPEEILEDICKEEIERSEEFDDDEEKSYGEKLDDAEFILNYYDDEYDDDEEEEEEIF